MFKFERDACERHNLMPLAVTAWKHSTLQAPHTCLCSSVAIEGATISNVKHYLTFLNGSATYSKIGPEAHFSLTISPTILKLL